jgi:hypothetical protein
MIDESVKNNTSEGQDIIMPHTIAKDTPQKQNKLKNTILFCTVYLYILKKGKHLVE